ncbi:MAG: hypothetical protein IE917_11620 [Betaproteobacteria bacterium]|nr:hypothetical protein [Betaproteobacteria bacterium]
MKTTAERQREITRSKALVHLLRDRMGETSVYGFAGRYDGLMQGAANTQDSKKWRSVFKGQQPLTARTLASLSELFPDAAQLHQDGPANLWRAMWGTLEESRAVIADDLSAWRSFDVALAEFEADLLLAESYREPLTLQHLAKAVALHRLHHDLLGLDGAGTCRCIWRCLDDENVQAALRRFAVLDEVRANLAAIAGDPLASVPADQRWDALEPKLGWIS